MLYITCRSIDEVMLNCQHDRMGFSTLTHFDCQFLFISGSLKNDVLTSVSHIKLQTPITHRRPTILLIYMAEFTIKCPVIVCTQTLHETKPRGNKCIKETNSEWTA